MCSYLNQTNQIVFYHLKNYLIPVSFKKVHLAVFKKLGCCYQYYKTNDIHVSSLWEIAHRLPYLTSLAMFVYLQPIKSFKDVVFHISRALNQLCPKINIMLLTQLHECHPLFIIAQYMRTANDDQFAFRTSYGHIKALKRALNLCIMYRLCHQV